MKKCICVWGLENYGKSSSIIEFDKILNNSFGKNIQNVINPVGTYNDDILRIYKINNTIIGNVIVGIESQGDPKSRQGSSLSLFAQKKCNFVICASRSKGNTVLNVENFCHNNKYDCYWISTLYSPDTFQKYGTKLNQRNGENIFEIFNDLMKGRY